MKKISFNKIETREELINRIEDNNLSIGCYLPRLRHLLSETPTETHTTLINVIYSAMYGNKTKQFYI